MKKLILIGIITTLTFQSFSFAPGTSRLKVSYSAPANLNAMTLQDFLDLSPKKYQELTGIKLNFSQRIAFAILKAKLKRQMHADKPAAHKTDIGTLSIILGGGAFLVALIPVVGIISIPMALGAIVLGIIGLGRKKGDTKSIIGLVLGSVFLLLIIAAVAAFASGGWF